MIKGKNSSLSIKVIILKVLTHFIHIKCLHCNSIKSVFLCKQLSHKTSSLNSIGYLLGVDFSPQEEVLICSLDKDLFELLVLVNNYFLNGFLLLRIVFLILGISGFAFNF